MREREITIDRPASEASALLAVRNCGLLAAHGWSAAFWTCTDEEPVERALGVLGHRDGRKGGRWDLRRPKRARAKPARRTEDSEAMAGWGEYVYLFGSHFGTKGGRLRPRRHFVARFSEQGLEGPIDEQKMVVEVARGSFRLHRLLNDALAVSGIELIARGPREERCIARTRKRGEKRGKRWAGRVHPDDRPVNLEGVAFRPEGGLLLGLRYPVTAGGNPIVAELDGIDGLFGDPPREPVFRALWVLAGVGNAGEPRGIRALESKGEELHVITGSLDSDAAESLILTDHPEGGRARSQHHRFVLPAGCGGRVEAELVSDFGGEGRVEGLTADRQGAFWYVLDDERIRLRRPEP